jgi:hypothetical protein
VVKLFWSSGFAFQAFFRGLGAGIGVASR